MDDLFTAQYLAPVATAQPIPNLVQFDQKKAPAFFNDPRRDPISIREWIKRIDHMKTAQGWDEAQTYSNAKNSLFGAAAHIMDTQCDARLNEDFTETWAWLKKALKKNFDNCATSRAYVDLIFAIKPQTTLEVDLSATSSKMYNDFKTIREIIPDTVVGPAPGVGGYTQAQAQKLVDDEKLRVVDAFAYAFIVNMLPSEMRTKILDKKPESIAQALEHIHETQQRLKDEKRPVTASGLPGPKLNAVQNLEKPDDSMERLCNMVMQRMGNFKNNNNQNNRKNNNNKKKSGGNQNPNSNNLPKKCNYCQKKGHGTIECFKRKEDKAPCYNAKGEAFYPEGESASKVNETPGSVFRAWV